MVSASHVYRYARIFAQGGLSTGLPILYFLLLGVQRVSSFGVFLEETTNLL
jgi:hypothetical protein